MKRWLWILGICAAAACAYGPVWHAGFVWDDDAHVTRPDLRGLGGLERIWTEPGATQQYYPVLHSAFWVEHRLWGDAPAPYHVVNVCWHVGDAILLGFLLEALLGSATAAWIAAALFALHPMAAESAAWISEQKNTLSTAFYLGAAWAYLRFDRERKGGWYAAASLLFLGALLSKSVTATLPISLLIVLWWKQGRGERPCGSAVPQRPSPSSCPARISGSASGSYSLRPRWMSPCSTTTATTTPVGQAAGRRFHLGKPAHYPLVPWIIAAVAAGVATSWLERTQIGARGPDFALEPVQRLLLASRIWWFYLGKFVWPHPLLFVYPRWTIRATEVWNWIRFGTLAFIYLLLLLRTSAAQRLFRARSTRKVERGVPTRWRAPQDSLATVFLLYGIALGPVLGFVNVYPFLFSYVADHFAYLALLPLCAGAGILLARSSLGIGLAAALALTFACLTHAAVQKYRSSETLYRATLERNPGAWLAHLNLGGLLAERGETAAAVAQMRMAEQQQPDYPSTHFNLGKIYLAQGQPAPAAEEFGRAIALAPRDAEAHDNRGIALAQLGDDAAAEAEFQAALRARPRYPMAHCNRAILFWHEGRLEAARSELNEALKEEPGLPAAVSLLRQLDARSP